MYVYKICHYHCILIYWLKIWFCFTNTIPSNDDKAASYFTAVVIIPDPSFPLPAKQQLCVPYPSCCTGEVQAGGWTRGTLVLSGWEMNQLRYSWYYTFGQPKQMYIIVLISLLSGVFVCPSVWLIVCNASFIIENLCLWTDLYILNSSADIGRSAIMSVFFLVMFVTFTIFLSIIVTWKLASRLSMLTDLGGDRTRRVTWVDMGDVRSLLLAVHVKTWMFF